MPDGRILADFTDLSIEGGEVELHLADEFGLEPADLQLDRHETLQATVEQQEVDEVLLSFYLQAKLAAHKREHAAHGAEEALDAGDESSLQLALAVFLAELKKIKSVFVPYRQLCLGSKLSVQFAIEIGLAEKSLLVDSRSGGSARFWSSRTSSSSGCRTPAPRDLSTCRGSPDASSN